MVYDETIGYIGKIKKSVLKEFDLADQDIYCLDINLERLITSINRYVRTYEAYDHHQEVTRDITFQLKMKLILIALLMSLIVLISYQNERLSRSLMQLIRLIRTRLINQPNIRLDAI